ncbi:MAG: HNH endonuclease signature motif containing protein [Anaeromyxobacteraceae bacterium]
MPPELVPPELAPAAASNDAVSAQAASSITHRDPLGDRWDLRAPRWDLPTFTLFELRELWLRGDGGLEKYERALAQGARMLRALQVSRAAVLAKFTEGDRLARLGFSSLGDFTENLLGTRRRAAQVEVQLSKALRERPLLRAAVHAGTVSPSAALAVLPVTPGDDEARWVERAAELPVRRLKQEVKRALKERKALPGPDAAEEKREEDEAPWVHLDVPVSDRASERLHKALALAGELVESPHRFVQLEALGQEFLSEHPGDEWDVKGAELALDRTLHPLDVPTKRNAAEAKLESETSSWEFLDPVVPVPAVELDPLDAATDDDLYGTALGLSLEIKSWEDLIGFCSAVVKGARLHKEAGFVDFRHYATERLGVPARTIETRAALEKHLWEKPELKVAKEMGLSYSKLLLLKEVPQDQILEFAKRAETLTVVELKEAVQARTDAHMSASKRFRVWVPRRVALLLHQAFLASLALPVTPEEAERPQSATLDGAFLGKLADHFIAVWGGDVMEPKTVSQKQRAKYPRCCFPGCSRRSDHGHHIEFRSHGGSEDAWNRMPLCAFHHHVVVHGGHATITGIFPEAVEFRVNGVVWKDGQFGRTRAERV